MIGELVLLSLVAAPPAGTASQWASSPTIGTWNGSLPTLPQTSAGNLPHSPMLGNGYMGVQLATARASASIVNASTRGLAAPQASLHLYIGSNSMWAVYPATDPGLGPKGKATRRAVGGVSLSGLESLPGSSVEKAEFSAEQRILDGQLRTSTLTSAGTFATVATMDPRANVLTLACSWAPNSQPPASQQQGTATMPVNLTLSTWTVNTYPGTPPGQHLPAVLPTTASVLGGDVLVATREAVPTGVASPRRIKVALAATVQAPAVLHGASSAVAVETDPVSAASGVISFDSSVRSAFTVTSPVNLMHPPPSLSLSPCVFLSRRPRVTNGLSGAGSGRDG